MVCESLPSLLHSTWSRHVPGNRVPWQNPVSRLRNKIVLLQFLTVRVLITLGPVIRKLFTDLKQRKEKKMNGMVCGRLKSIPEKCPFR